MKKESRKIYKSSYWILILICLGLVVFVSSIILMIRRIANKIIKINDLYFFNFKRLNFIGKEEILFSSIYNQSRINKKVDNRTITEIFYDENLNYGMYVFKLKWTFVKRVFSYKFKDKRFF